MSIHPPLSREPHASHDPTAGVVGILGYLGTSATLRARLDGIGISSFLQPVRSVDPASETRSTEPTRLQITALARAKISVRTTSGFLFKRQFSQRFLLVKEIAALDLCVETNRPDQKNVSILA
jgi:hypothetical protein